MRQVTTTALHELLGDHPSPCVSVYMPTHRRHPDNQQDPIRYRNSVRAVEQSLRQKYPTRDVRAIVDRFEPLARDDRFWNHRTDGLALFATADTFEWFELQHPVPEVAVVADRFHTKPLLRGLQAADRYQVLALDRHKAALFEGNRHALDPVELTDVPTTITQALGEELTEQHLTVASYGAGAARAAGSGAPPAVHAHGDKQEEVDIDRDRFFREVDRGILAHHTLPSGLPLMLAALPEHHAPFRTVSHNPHLLAEGVRTNPDALRPDQLRTEAWRVVEPAFQQRLRELADAFQVARAREHGSAELREVAEAVVAGRVDTLLVEEGKTVPGRVDRDTGRVKPGKLSDPEVGDVLNDLAEAVLRMKGQVVVVPADRMPTPTGLAATYRF